jgi:hypothetical protein
MLTVILEAPEDDEYFCVTARSASRQERREWVVQYEETS